jgi:hypothetical protein
MNDPTNGTALVARRETFSLAPRTLPEAFELAKIMADSEFVPKDYRGKPGNVLVAVQMGAEVGLAPMQALQNIACISGRPSMWGDAVLALVRGSGLLEGIDETIDGDVAICTVKRRGEASTSRSFSLEDAKRAGLANKEGPWRTYPKRMLQMRARSWALRDVFPDVLRGLCVREEVEDFETIEATATVAPAPHAAPVAPPRRKSEAPPAQQPAKAEQPAGGSAEELATVTGVRSEEGTTNGRPWKLYRVTLGDGREVGTFSDTIAAKAQQAADIGAQVSLALEMTKRGNLGIKALELVEAAAALGNDDPGADIDEAFNERADQLQAADK